MQCGAGCGVAWLLLCDCSVVNGWTGLVWGCITFRCWRCGCRLFSNLVSWPCGGRYGEHVLTDLGPAFTEGNSNTVKSFRGRTMYPAVGIRRGGDKLTLSHKWLSCPGVPSHRYLSDAAWLSQLLASWGRVAAPAGGPALEHWHKLVVPARARLAREAWRQWQRWTADGRFVRVQSRGGVYVDINTSEAACRAIGSPFMAGDVVTVATTNGRALDTPETAQVLGVYKGHLVSAQAPVLHAHEQPPSATWRPAQLVLARSSPPLHFVGTTALSPPRPHPQWYRLKRAAGTDGKEEGASLAWYWLPAEVAKLKRATAAPQSTTNAGTATGPIEFTKRDIDGTLAMVRGVSFESFCALAGLPCGTAPADGGDDNAPLQWSARQDVALVRLVNLACVKFGRDAVDLAPWEVFGTWRQVNTTRRGVPAALEASRGPQPPVWHDALSLASVLPQGSRSDGAIMARVCVLRVVNQAALRVLPLVSLATHDEPRVVDPRDRHPVPAVSPGVAPDMRRATAAAAMARADPALGAGDAGAVAGAGGEADAQSDEAWVPLGWWSCEEPGRWYPQSLGQLLRTRSNMLFTSAKRALWTNLLAATTTTTQLAQDE